MTPVAAYYLFVAEENERAAAKAYRSPKPRPSLLERLRAVARTLRTKPQVARAA
jgi:hypothetical protein